MAELIDNAAGVQTASVAEQEANSKEPMIRIEGLHKSFGDHEVLRGIDLSVMPEEGAAAYNIQITGASALSASVRETVGRMAPGVELSRVGQDFIVGRFDDETQAEQVAEASRSVDGKLTVKVMQIVD